MIDLTVVPDDGDRYEITAAGRDLLAWERTGRGKSFQKLMEDLNMIDLFKIAWLASRRQGRIAGSMTLEQFEQTHEVTFEGGEDPDPTQPEAFTS